MIEFTPMPEENVCDDFKPPPYGKPGRILVRVLGKVDTTYRYETEVLDSDSDSGVFWINEGVGYDYWFDQYIDKFPADEGTFVIEGIVGTYIRGRGWITGDICEEDDEEWEYKSIRPATAREIETECLQDTEEKS